MPVFGFKAKQLKPNLPADDQCSMPVFGFKAKQQWREANGAR